jgi:hypothetical protein
LAADEAAKFGVQRALFDDLPYHARRDPVLEI